MDARVEVLNIIEARRNLELATAFRVANAIDGRGVMQTMNKWIALMDSATPSNLGSVDEFFSPRNRVKGAPVRKGKA